MRDFTPPISGEYDGFLEDLAQPALLIRGELVLAMSPTAAPLFGHRKTSEFTPAPLASLLGESIAAQILGADNRIPSSFPITIKRPGRIHQSAIATRASMPDPESFVLLLSVKHRSMLEIISNEYRGLLDTLPDLVMVHDELGTKFFGYQLRRQTPEGENVDLHIRSMPFWKDGIQDLVLLVGKTTTRDESRQLRLEAARLRAEADSASKSAVLAQTSHEIRTPLNIVFGMIDMALDQTISPSASEYLTMARSAALTLLSLLDDFLEFSKLEAGKLPLRESFFSPEAVIREAYAGLELMAKEKDLRLRLVIDSNLPTRVFGDAGRLRQIIANLTTNAIKYTEKGTIRGKVDLASMDAEGCHLHLRIADTGCGISPQALPSLFQPFYQINEDTEGSGLGLAIVKELVQLLGGRVWVESVEGKGSEFHFTAKFRFTAPPTSPETDSPPATVLDNSP
jgi:signal transduction histidine kinase